MLVDKKWISDNYKKFNKMYFDNKLPEVKVKISSSKRFLGMAKASFDLDAKAMCDYSISISNYYDQPEVDKVSTLLHEMIHIKDYYENGKEIYATAWSKGKHRGHGEFFLKEAQRVTTASGVKIDVKASSEVMEAATLSANAEKKMNEDYWALVSPERGYAMFRLPKNFNKFDVKQILHQFNLESCYLIKGNFKVFAGKRGSLKNGKVIGEERYHTYMQEAKTVTSKINKK